MSSTRLRVVDDDFVSPIFAVCFSSGHCGVGDGVCRMSFLSVLRECCPRHKKILKRSLLYVQVCLLLLDIF